MPKVVYQDAVLRVVARDRREGDWPFYDVEWRRTAAMGDESWVHERCFGRQPKDDMSRDWLEQFICRLLERIDAMNTGTWKPEW